MTKEQRQRALKAANDVRCERARIKRELAIGERDVRELLEHPPESCLKMSTTELVRALPRYGKGRAEKALRTIGASEDRPVGMLSPRQRAELAALVG